MISDAERRKAAAKLRSLDESIDGAPFICTRQEHDAMALRAIRAVVGKGDVFHLLADLIEPQERTDEVPVGEIPGGYIIRNPRKPLLDVTFSQNAFDVLPKVDNILEYISESVNYEVERKLFKRIAEAYGWKVMGE